MTSFQRATDTSALKLAAMYFSVISLGSPQNSPLPTPSMAGPLQQLPPSAFDAGPFGTLDVNGVLSGMGLWQSNHVPGDNSTHPALSNGQIMLQKTEGWWQFYVQAGAYNVPILGAPFLSTEKTLTNFFGPVPVGYLKITPAKNTSVEIGSLPTLIGAEYTFTFENMNIERGLLWNQEPAVSRGIQLNQTFGKFNASLSWNDGFYSNRYTWLSGALTYASGPHSLEFVAGGNYGRTGYQTAATPVQNNSSIYDVIYTCLKGPWTLQPYFQYTRVPAEPGIGIVGASSTKGGAILISHSFGHGVSLAGRWEYLTSTGSVNLLFGPGSDGLSFTLTPTLQYGGFFVRGDLSWVHAISDAPGSAFGSSGMNTDQPRAIAEIGFLFGDNIAKTH